ncbi:hypothetical protein K458DRAFT_15062 [Lentithecium fluviatile CBS 122367]|uniref:Uncharacterized protein n=1 Tax=Lentithecium fluviatile CBS 122367 TaxID=1168545 RepID=A0A6G1J525_9PLEO|nr:hypothetical protein K458DRAFT_15062 [Lentithecium fluviatile CBS 122367]
MKRGLAELCCALRWGGRARRAHFTADQGRVLHRPTRSLSAHTLVRPFTIVTCHSLSSRLHAHCCVCLCHRHTLSFTLTAAACVQIHSSSVACRKG